MRTFLTLLRREWSALFLSPMAYVIMVCFLLLMGASLGLLLQVLAQGPAHGGVMRILLGESLFFWLAMLLVVPVITMRQFAEEKRAGTLETLMTAPVGDVAVVLSKYAASWIFFAVLWAPTTAYGYLLAGQSANSAAIDYGTLVTAYGGIGLIGSLFLAIGLLASALTRSQAVAAMLSLVALCALFFWGFAPYYARPLWVQEVGRYTSPVLHMIEFSRGVLDTRPLIFYSTSTVFVLFATVKVIESRKWRA